MATSLRAHLRNSKRKNASTKHCCCVIIFTLKIKRFHLIIIIILLLSLSLWIDSVIQLSIDILPGSEQQQLVINAQSQHYRSFDELTYSRSYDKWIKGIGNTELLNNDPTSNCLYPSVPFLLTYQQTFNPDMLFINDHKIKHKQFSKVFGRSIIIQCENNKVLYFESPTIYNPKPKPPNKQWQSLTNSTDNIFILYLQNSTQTVWLRCAKRYNFHITLLPLKHLNPDLYQTKQAQIKHHFGEDSKLPPNIVIFIIDSTSRSSFIRGAPLSVEYLSEIMNNPLIDDSKSPWDIIQFFRYSTVGWGTGINLNALIGGTCTTNKCENVDISNCLGLPQFYHELGYFVPGYMADDTKKTQWQSDSNCDFYLSENVVPKAHEIINRYDIEVFINDIVLSSVNDLQRNYDKDIPYFMILHGQSNHVQTSESKMFTLDKYIRKLLEDIDKTNTILHIISDHGSMIGDSVKNLYGRWEISNPVSIMILPKHLRESGIIDIDILRRNEQKLVNHFDLHLFYKELMLNMIKNDDNNKWKQSVQDTLPKFSNGEILSQSILSTEIKSNRECTGIANGFCFCDLFETKEITKNVLIEDRKYIELMINSINDLTGNGEWNCLKLDPDDFTVRLHMINSGGNIELIVEYKQFNLSDKEYEKMKKENRLLSYLVYIDLSHKDDETLFEIPVDNHSIGKLPKIIRIDFFKYEKCLTTEYQDYKHEFAKYSNYFVRDVKHQFGDSVEPIFVDKSMTIEMLQRRKLWNLRLCKCKS